ncbi:uncharacterized protein LOC130048573 [Ostrea edulis]|uniref:uncharacterized protein LOC130048573 n=1 Tax=Ostrea edulis TaxID=37623 RepID=UPI0024AEB82F|nr:uncharacterized protein LOC130048573 [Ostrea edulis]
MSQDNILNVLRQSNDGTPASVLTTPTFATFPVTSVNPSTEAVISSTKPWPETSEGIAVLTTIGVTILLTILFFVLFCVCTRNRKYKLGDDDHGNERGKPKTIFEKKRPNQEPFVISVSILKNAMIV